VNRLPNPAKTLAHLPPASTIELSHRRAEDAGNMDVLTVRIEAYEDGCATVSASRHPGDSVFHILAADATGGWGPIAYDILMEYATLHGDGLSPDPAAVSKEARAVWKHYASRRADVTRTAEPRGTWRSARGKFPAARFVYQKKPTLLTALAKARHVTYVGLWKPYAPKRVPRLANPTTGRRQNPAKRIVDLSDASVQLTTTDYPKSRTVAVQVLDPRGAIIASVTATGRPGEPFQIEGAYAQHGWGPFVYDVLMERVTELGGMLSPSSYETSPEAERVWMHYLQRRADVKTHHLSDEIVESRQMEGDRDTYRFEADDLGYTKEPVVLHELRRLGSPRFVEQVGPPPVGRAPNPVTPAALARHEMPVYAGYKDAAVQDMILRSIAQAERDFEVTAEDSILGCGGNGCVVQLADGDLLKITKSLSEVAYVDVLGQLTGKDAEGFVRIGMDGVREVPFGYAYVREKAQRMLTLNDHRRYDAALERVDASQTAEEYLKNVARMSAEHPALRALARTLTAAAKKGTLLFDVVNDNVAWRDDHTIIGLDAMGAQQ
jgi:hypothetical protein